MVMSELKPRLAVAAILIGFFAIFRGHARGTELPPRESGLLYSTGFAIATGCLPATGFRIGVIGAGLPDAGYRQMRLDLSKLTVTSAINVYSANPIAWLTI
jgi:hydrogenase/urease accessory protein HupE